MKIFFAILLSLLMVIDMSLYTLGCSVAVPLELVENNATLVFSLQDLSGNKIFGKCRLTSDLVTQKIFQNQLEMIADPVFVAEVVDGDAKHNILFSNDGVDLSGKSDIVVVACQFDPYVIIDRVLVIQADSVVENDPFADLGTWFDSLPAEEEGEKAENDEDSKLTALTARMETLNTEGVACRRSVSSSWFNEYMAYAKLFVLMQYGKMCRRVRDFSNWRMSYVG